MKKIFILLVAIISLGNFSGFSQGVKASLGAGTTPNNVILYLTPDATQTATIGTLQFNIGVATGAVTTAPTLSVVSNVFGSAVTWIVGTPYSEGGYWNYNIYTASSPLQPSFTTGTELQIMELNFSGGVPDIASVSLVTLPDGGTQGGNALFLCTGTIQSNGSSLYYTRPGTTINNNFSYDITGNSSGSTTSTATLTSVVVPVKFTGFSATKKADAGILNWAVANEGVSADHYVVERSIDDINFKGIATVAVKGGGTTNTYTYSDENVSSLNASVIYYRITQVDKNGQTASTEIKAISISSGVSISAYPNPVKDFVTVAISLQEAASLSISLSDASGKTLQQLQVAGAKGLNNQPLNLSSYASGNYLLKVNNGTSITTLSIVKN